MVYDSNVSKAHSAKILGCKNCVESKSSLEILEKKIYLSEHHK